MRGCVCGRDGGYAARPQARLPRPQPDDSAGRARTRSAGGGRTEDENRSPGGLSGVPKWPSHPRRRRIRDRAGEARYSSADPASGRGSGPSGCDVAAYPTNRPAGPCRPPVHAAVQSLQSQPVHAAVRTQSVLRPHSISLLPCALALTRIVPAWQTTDIV